MTHDRQDPARTDEDLVRAARAGDERALSRLVERHHGTVYRVVLTIVRDAEYAADVTQDTFLKAFRALDTLRGGAAFRSWLLAIASNEARGVLRKVVRRRETSIDDAPPMPSEGVGPARQAVIRTEAERARACLAKLPEKQRLAIQLRIDDGLSFREVGEMIGSTEGAARVNYHHGMRRLREMLDP